MSDEQSDIPSWTRSPWVKWSWLLLLIVVVAQNVDYHWRALPTSATGYYARARADYLQGKYGDAVDNLTKAIGLRPKDTETYILRGEAYVKLHDLGRAMPDLEKALELDPDYENSRAAYADGRAAAWDSEGAIEHYTRALAANPSFGRCYLKRGKLLYDTGRWDDAAADLRRAATVLMGDDQVTAQLLLWVARARAGEAFGATNELAGVMRAGRIRDDRFWTSARFLCGEVTESMYLASVTTIEDGDEDELKAEAFFLAGAKRLAFGDRAGGLALMHDALETRADTSYAFDRARVELENLLLGFHPMRIEEAARGLTVASVTPGGPAEAFGIRRGGVLTAIGGTATDQAAFLAFLAKAEPGSTVELQLVDGAEPRASVPLRFTLGASAPTR